MQPLSLAQARRAALAAQGFCDPPHARPTARTVARAVRRTGLLQVDSVNVLRRAHYLPVYSRVGAYDTALLDQAASGAGRRTLVEYWAHVAALMPVELWPVMGHRMRGYRDGGHPWVGRPDEALAAELLAELAGRGAATSRDLDAGLPRSRDHWGWNWSGTKRALEYLFAAGQVAVAGRNSQFERVYDLPERVLPPQVLAAPELPAADAHRELVRRAARSHGVATARCLADYHRLPAADARRAVAELVEDGELVPVRVEGWQRAAYLHRDARLPRAVAARALLSPFDPLVWERARTEALFGFRYRIEIYTPRDKRVHGYYVLPFLLGERLVARVDLKADRAAGELLVQGAHAEPDAPPETAGELAAELRRLADWLGLGGVTVAGGGDLAAALR